MKHILAITAVVGLSAGFAFAADEPAAKCPVSGARVNMEKFSEFNGGKVYFCCGNCKAKFDKSSDKFAAKANHQMVVTKQAKQTKCPLAGRPMNDSKTVEVGGVEVAFCCPNCQGKVAGAEGDKQIALVFSNKAFKKGFELAAAN